METFWQDIKYGARMLWKSPGFTIVALLALTLGIGANSAIFSLVNSILLRPLPYPEADRLIFFGEWAKQVPTMSISMANFNDFRDRSRLFDGMVAFRSQNYTMTGSGDPERVNGRQVTWGFFPTLKIQPLIGRGFGPEEDKVGAERVVLLSEAFWARRFARDPGVLNKQLMLNGESYTVIGVLPTNAFHATWRTSDVFTSLWRLEDILGGANSRGNHPGIYAFARMKPGVTYAQAEAELKGIAERLAQEYPNSNKYQSASVQPLHDAVIGSVRDPLMVLLGAVGFVLLIACANVANLLLARAASRSKEIAVRTALGAGRMRLIRQMLTESVLLAITGGAAGTFLAWAAVRALVAASPTTIPRLSEISLDGWVLAFTAGISVLTGLIFGLAPALHASKPEMAETLKEGGRGMSGSASRHRVRSSLVVAEISLALVLLVGAGLMLKSFARLTNADAGFEPGGVLIANVTLPATKYPQTPDKRQPARNFNTQVIEKMRALPGVQYAATALPLLGGWQTSFHVQGTPIPEPGQAPSTDITRVSPDYFKVMGVRLQKGRYFTEGDIEGAQRVCIVDETMVKTRWPNDDPIGKQMRLGSGPIQQGQDPQWMTVVGVVAHVKNYGVDQDSREETYVPYMQAFGGGTMLVRTTGDPAQLTSAVRQAVLSVDPDVPIFGARSLSAIVSDNVAPRRMSVNLLGGFAGLALLLAAVGIYGVMSYAVSQRTHEIGIRMALGAGKGDIFRLVVGQGMWLAGVGVALGIGMAYGLAFWLRTFLSSLLFGVSQFDASTYALIPIVLVVVALMANYIPARRAMKVDPLVALRYE